MEAINLEGHNNPIYAVVAHPEKKLCYTAGNDKGIVEWDIALKKFSRLFTEVAQTIYCLEIILSQNILVAGCNNGHILIFDLETTTLKFTIDVKSPVFCLKYGAHKNELLASTDAGEILVINTDEQKIIHQFQSGSQKIRSFDFNYLHNILVTSSNDNSVRVYKLEDYTFMQQLESHTMGVGAVAFSPDGNTMLTGSRDAHLKAWDTVSWLCKKDIAAHLFAIYLIAFHPTLPYFATCSRDKSIKIWRTTDYSLLKNLGIDKGVNAHRLSVNQICWSADGENLISVSDDKLVKVWKLD